MDYQKMVVILIGNATQATTAKQSNESRKSHGRNDLFSDPLLWQAR